MYMYKYMHTFKIQVNPHEINKTTLFMFENTLLC